MLVRCDYPNEDKKSVIIDTEEDWGKFLEYIWQRCGNDVRDYIMRLVFPSEYNALYNEYQNAVKQWDANKERADEAEDELFCTQEERDECIETINEMLFATKQLEKMTTEYVGDFPFHVCFWAKFIQYLVIDEMKSNRTIGKEEILRAKQCWQKHGDLEFFGHKGDFEKEQVNW